MLALKKAVQSEQNPSAVSIYVAEHVSLSFIQVVWVVSDLKRLSQAVHTPFELKI